MTKHSIEVIETKLEHIINTLSEMNNRISEVHEQTKKTNGRVLAIEKWRERIAGGSAAIKGIWGVVGVFFVAMAFGLFQMYIQVQKMDQVIADEVEKRLSQLEFEVIR